MSKTHPLDFTVTDFKGSTTSLSSFNLSITPLTFLAVESAIVDGRTKIVWDFGDGTQLEQSSPSYYYKTAGIYRVRLLFYDCVDQGVRSTVEKEIRILNYVEDTFRVSVPNNILSASSGGLTSPITISQTLPVDSISNTIRYTVSGSNTTNYFFLDRNKYDHLKPYNALLTSTYNESLADYELKEVDVINIDSTPMFVSLSGNNIVSAADSSTSIIAGYSGASVFYYRDDLPCSLFNLEFSKAPLDNSNTLNITLTGKITQSPLFSGYNGINSLSGGLSITSNGLDGDNIPNNIFNIDSIKFVTTAIPFFIKLKGYDNKITIKNSKPLGLSAFGSNNFDVIIYKVDGPSTFSVLPSTKYTIGSLQHTISTYGLSGCFRGYMEFTGITEPTQCVMYVKCSSAHVPQTIGPVLSAAMLVTVSTPFTVYPKDYYTVYKKNENFDAEGMFRSLGTQESLARKDIFFEKFLGVIFGNQLPDSEAIGKKIYERIANFVDNNTNINTAEITQLLSLGEMADSKLTIFNTSLVAYPDKLRRFISLLSINKPNLFGYRNQFAKNFNDKGFADQTVFGVNLGAEINLNTEIIPNDYPYIVSYEKFSRKYILLNAWQPIKAYLKDFVLKTEAELEILTESAILLLAEAKYKLKDYSVTWGWPLILPTNSNSASLSTYYDFYYYIDTPANNSVGGTIDFDTSSLSVTASRASLVNDGGIFEQIILNTLYQSLSLTK